MKLKVIAVVLIFGMVGCNHAQQAKQKSEEDRLYVKTLDQMKAHVELLRAAGRWPDENEEGGPDAFAALGKYDWHFSKGGGYFGAYSFYQPAFDQAMRSWFFHGQMAEGSDILVNVGHGKFDKSAVGYMVGSMTYCSLHGGVLHHCEERGFDGGKVVEFIDATHLRLDKKARWDSEMYGMSVTPPDYVDMCNCTNNFSPFKSEVPADLHLKPCVQGGDLAPGESCSVSVTLGMTKP